MNPTFLVTLVTGPGNQVVQVQEPALLRYSGPLPAGGRVEGNPVDRLDERGHQEKHSELIESSIKQIDNAAEVVHGSNKADRSQEEDCSKDRMRASTSTDTEKWDGNRNRKATGRKGLKKLKRGCFPPSIPVMHERKREGGGQEKEEEACKVEKREPSRSSGWSSFFLLFFDFIFPFFGGLFPILICIPEKRFIAFYLWIVSRSLI